ncbi:MAG: hypothetical protein J6Y29_07160 [Clostridiales bacterium]|nr:hypothetical protein [Clostridiales bacterium]
MKDFNFLPKGYVEELRLKNSDKWLKKIVIPYAVVMTLMVSVPMIINIKLSMDKKKVQSEVSNENYYKKKSEQYKILQKIYQQREEQANMLDNYGIDPTDVVKDLQEVMPDNMYIEYLRFNKAKGNVWNLSMKCVAKTQEDAATFLEVLRKDKRYYKGLVLSFNKGVNDTTEFNFSCTYETGRG